MRRDDLVSLYRIFKQRYDHAPNLAEWQDFVLEETGSANKAVKLRVATRVFEEIESIEVMSSEIETKVRDAESNLNNRKYNFGNF